MDEKNISDNEKNKTAYGEFIPSYFAWVTPEDQKEKAEEMDDMTKK